MRTTLILVLALVTTSCKKEECEPEVVNVPGPTVFVEASCADENFGWLDVTNTTAAAYYFYVNGTFWDVTVAANSTVDSVHVPKGSNQVYRVVRIDGGQQYEVSNNTAECTAYYWIFP